MTPLIFWTATSLAATTPIALHGSGANPADEWLLFAAEDVGDPACHIFPWEDRAEGFLHVDDITGAETLELNAGKGQNSLVQVLAYRTDWFPPAYTGNVGIQSRSIVDTSAGPTDVFVSGEAQFAINEPNPDVGGSPIYSYQFTVRVHAHDAGPGVVSLWTTIGGVGQWSAVHTLPAHLDYTTSPTTIRFVVDPVTKTYVGDLQVAVGLELFTIDIDGISSGNVPQPDWAASSTLSVEVGNDPGNGDCTDRMGRQAVLQYDLEYVGFWGDCPGTTIPCVDNVDILEGVEAPDEEPIPLPLPFLLALGGGLGLMGTRMAGQKDH